MKQVLCFLSCCFAFIVLPVFSACPLTDFMGARLANLADLSVIVEQLLFGNWFPEDLVVIFHAGTFQGDDGVDEGRSYARTVSTRIQNPFLMSRYETTNQQYCDFLNSVLNLGLVTVISGVVYPSDSGTNYPYCDTATSVVYSQIVYSEGFFSLKINAGRSMAHDPMMLVTWYGAVAYCNWHSQQQGRQPCYNLVTWACDFTQNGYLLPTDAEWEYAARGGLSFKRFPWGDTISHRQANYYSNKYIGYDVSPTIGDHPSWEYWIPCTSPVGSFPANGFGLYDMAGNVAEWCNDGSSDADDQTVLLGNPADSSNEKFRILHGGGWQGDGGSCRVSCRGRVIPSCRNLSIGFRVVRNHYYHNTKDSLFGK